MQLFLMDAIIKRIHTGADDHLSTLFTEAATTRLRPIFLTTITTVIGMIPLTFASALFGPLALAILFGLTFAMILTLLLIPMLVKRCRAEKYLKITGDFVRRIRLESRGTNSDAAF